LLNIKINRKNNKKPIVNILVILGSTALKMVPHWVTDTFTQFVFVEVVVIIDGAKTQLPLSGKKMN
jgi:hypothetical protein